MQEDNPGFGQGGVIRGDGQEAKPGFGQGVDSSFAGFPSSQGSQTSGNQVLNPAFGSSINQLGNLRHWNGFGLSFRYWPKRHKWIDFEFTTICFNCSLWEILFVEVAYLYDFIND